MRLKTIIDILPAFAAFILLAPRSTGETRVTDFFKYAEQVIYSVRGHYTRIHGRIPGLTEVPLEKQRIYTMRGFFKLAPRQTIAEATHYATRSEDYAQIPELGEPQFGSNVVVIVVVSM